MNQKFKKKKKTKLLLVNTFYVSTLKLIIMKTLFFNTWITIIFFSMILSGCDDNGGEPVDTTGNLQVNSDAVLGQIITDGNGMTLYFFSNDADGTSACQGGCLDAWPVFHADNLQVPSALSTADFGTITRGDGTMQTTYKGWPLYYFAQDQNPGDTNGEGVNDIWFVAKPDYTLMIANQAVTSGGSATKYLVDDVGNTLYFFTPDETNVSNCTDGCLANWPAFFEDETVVPSTITAADLATFTRTDGEGDQLSYQGAPLYYFIQDTQRGDTNGEGVNSVWFVQQP